MYSNLDDGGGFTLLAVYALRDFAPDCLRHVLAPFHARERERERETGVSVSREHVVRFWFVFVSDVRSCVRARVEVRLARTGARETSYSHPLWEHVKPRTRYCTTRYSLLTTPNARVNFSPTLESTTNSDPLHGIASAGMITPVAQRNNPSGCEPSSPAKE